MNRKGKTSWPITLITLAVLGMFGLFAWYLFGGTQQTALGPSGQVIQTPTGQVTTGKICPAQPTASYSTKDKYGTATVSGTAYYILKTNPATTTAQTNVNLGDRAVYWVSNSTYYMKPLELSINECTTPIVGEAINNGTATLTSWDIVNSRTTSGAPDSYNTSMPANGQANIRFTYQSTNKKGFMPFGGLLILEQNNTISDVTCNAPFIVDNTGSDTFKVTYTPTKSATHAYKTYKILPSIEDGKGTPMTFTCQYIGGASAPGAGSNYYATLIPANYYLTNDGKFALDVEQAANQLTTRTGAGTLVATQMWAA